MITVGMNYQVLPGKEQVFENAVKGVVEAMKGEPTHVRTELYRSVEGGGYLILSEWADKGAFHGFVRSEKFAKVTAWGREQILAGPPKHEIFER